MGGGLRQKEGEDQETSVKAVLEAASLKMQKEIEKKKSFGLDSLGSAVLNRCRVGAPGRDEHCRKYVKFFSAVQHIPTGGCKRRRTVFGALTGHLRGLMDQARLVLSHYHLSRYLQDSDFTNNAILFPCRIWAVCGRSGHFITAIHLV